jgi:serine/threonine protein kinase
MPLSVGDKLGPYEILALIGKGGMGEVYSAHDPRTGRDVAIKISGERFSERFDREVRAVAALNHPNICQLYDVGPNYLVMELVEGESPRGPLPIELALNYAQQIADALQAAHEKGIVHRDLKPGNIKITSNGVVKVLDFGLAKLGRIPDAKSEDSPTMSLAETEAGVILGTAAYMPPEQARGKPVDKRADIWAFGVVLYEMLTGERLFQGDSVTDVLAAVVKEEPKWDQVPARVRRLLRGCLQKDPKDRVHDIADAKLLLEDFGSEGGPARGSKTPWAIAAVFAIALAVALWAPWRTPPPPPEPIRTQVLLPENVDAASRNFTVSPDGRKLAFGAVGSDGVPRIWVRLLDSLEVRPLPGTETNPNTAPFFWSSDSRFVGYSTPQGKLMKVDLAGSPPQTLCDTAGPSNGIGGSWNADGVIIFGSTNGGLMRVSESGGMPSAVTVLDASRKETRHAFPTFLPDGRHFLYLRSSSVPENNGVFLGSLDVKPEEQVSRQILATTFGPVYAPSTEEGRGHLLILREGSVLAYAFDEGRMEITGEPVTVVEQVGSFIAAAFFSASHNGVLVYRSGGVSQDGRLAWYDRQGTYLIKPEQPTGLRVALSPDGERVALVRQDPGNPNWDIWAWDASRFSGTRMTSDLSGADFPVWSPDGSRVFFRSNREGPWNLYQKLANESKDYEVLLKSAEGKAPTSISRDGRWLLFTQADPKTKDDIWVLSNPGGGPGDRKASRFLNTEFNESEARFSPESETPRWVAYTSDESRQNQVYVREFSQNGRRTQVSAAGGTNPRWRADGKELFFAAPDGTVMSVDVTPGATFQASAPKTLFRVPSGLLPNWDVTGDGKRFLVLVQTQQSAQGRFTVLLNWQAVLKK